MSKKAGIAILVCVTARIGVAQPAKPLGAGENGRPNGHTDDSQVTNLRNVLASTSGQFVTLSRLSNLTPAEPALDAIPTAAEQTAYSEVDLLARVSHEMRTPLSAMIGYAQLIQCGTPTPTESQRRSIAMILRAGWHLEKLLKLTRELGLLATGSVSLPLGPVPLAGALQDCQAFILSREQLRGVRVHFPDLDPSWGVWGDAIRLQQVLGHLLSAAIDCSDAGAAILVECNASSAEWIRFCVHEGSVDDAGSQPTAPPPVAGHTTSESIPNEVTGIALLVARRLVELMGGRLGASSTASAGQLFSFELKRVPVPFATRPESDHPSDLHPGHPC